MVQSLVLLAFLPYLDLVALQKKLSNVISNSLIRQFDMSNYRLNGRNCFDNFTPNLSNHHNLCDKGWCFQNVSPLFLLYFSMRAFQRVKNHFIWRRFDLANHILNIRNPQSGSSTLTILKVHLFEIVISYGNVFTIFLHSIQISMVCSIQFKNFESFMFSLIPMTTFCCSHYYKNMVSMPLILQLQWFVKVHHTCPYWLIKYNFHKPKNRCI